MGKGSFHRFAPLVLQPPLAESTDAPPVAGDRRLGVHLTFPALPRPFLSGSDTSLRSPSWVKANAVFRAAVPLVGHHFPHHGPLLQVHCLLRLVGKTGSPHLHLRDLGVQIVAILPLPVARLFHAFPVKSNQLRPGRRLHSRDLRQSLLHPGEHGSVRLHVDQSPGPRLSRVARQRLLQIVFQKSPNTYPPFRRWPTSSPALRSPSPTAPESTLLGSRLRRPNRPASNRAHSLSRKPSKPAFSKTRCNRS